ncbi:CLUMA_CG014858, isoform A [Clunio marinus]|uniref:CLUMA_CG014858, isoform A n=1 Tax=Clunio marinus TaxID=568069 RepID=A0A1J1IN32_9DIPT|nr:CLUMA_CG014858, isoform A [Clunio marinus]
MPLSHHWNGTRRKINHLDYLSQKIYLIEYPNADNLITEAQLMLRLSLKINCYFMNKHSCFDLTAIIPYSACIKIVRKIIQTTK